MNAADYYSLEELRKACLGFIQSCINVDTVCALLASAEKYIQYKCTKSLVQKVNVLLYIKMLSCDLAFSLVNHLPFQENINISFFDPPPPIKLEPVYFNLND